MPFQKRDYQIKINNEINNCFVNGFKRVLAVAPTGSGKSVMIVHLVEQALARNEKVLIVVHRKNLVNQLISSIATTRTRVKQLKSGQISDSQVNIVMVQALKPELITQDVGLVIIDEAHSTGFFKNFEALLDKLNGSVWNLGNLKLVGFTATPFRTNKKEGFCRFYQQTVQAVSTRELIEQKFLTLPRFFKYDSEGLAKLKMSSSDGDYTKESLKIVCNQDYLDDVVDKWLEVSGSKRDIINGGIKSVGTKTIIFVSSVSNANYLKELIGYTSAIITAKTPDRERKATFEAFKLGSKRVLISVNALTEGYDETSIECVVIARPTKSLTLFLQMVGRGLRLHQNKDTVQILDFGGCLDQFKHSDNDVLGYYPVHICPSYFKTTFTDEKAPKIESDGQPFSLATMFLPDLVEAYSDTELAERAWLSKEIKDAFIKKIDIPFTSKYFARYGKFFNSSILRNLLFGKPNDYSKSFYKWYLEGHKLAKEFYEYEFGKDSTETFDKFDPIKALGLQEPYSKADVELAIKRHSTPNNQFMMHAFRERLITKYTL